MDPLIAVCAVDTLEEGASRGFDPTGTGRDTIFVVRRAGLHAYLNSCPHWPGTPLPWRKDAFLNAAGTNIVCSAHGAQFDIGSGACTLGPCLGQSLTRVPLTAGSDGVLRVSSGALHSNAGAGKTEMPSTPMVRS